METIFGRFETAHPDSNRNVRARVVPLNVRLLGTLDGWVPFIMAGIIVILVACANVANLMMARAVHRAPEIAIRTSLGASRSRIVGQLLIEAVVIAEPAPRWSGRSRCRRARGADRHSRGHPALLVRLHDGPRGVHRAGGLSLATIVVFGLIPALHASRTDVNRTLKDGGRANTGSGHGVLTGAFLQRELALAMILLNQVAIATYLANRSMPTDANINTTEVMTTPVTLPARPMPPPEPSPRLLQPPRGTLRQRRDRRHLTRHHSARRRRQWTSRLQIRGQAQPARTGRRC